MITPGYAVTMARYNHWQNGSLIAAASTLTDAQRREDHGAFFGSIHATFSHLLWADKLWMSRFADLEPPGGGITDSTTLFDAWDALISERQNFDRTIADWAAQLDPEWLQRELTWWSAAAKRELRRPLSLLLTHFFNHQTHHRGQIHAMLTAAGAKPGDTDLMLLPDDA